MDEFIQIHTRTSSHASTATDLFDIAVDVTTEGYT